MFFTNAALVEISAPGQLATNGDPGPPVVQWAGVVRGYLKRTRRQVISGGMSVNVHSDIFTLLRTAGAPVIEKAGANWEAYTVVIDDNRTPTVVRRRFIVRGMENRAAGTPVDSLRLQLDTEALS